MIISYTNTGSSRQSVTIKNVTYFYNPGDTLNIELDNDADVIGSNISSITTLAETNSNILSTAQLQQVAEMIAARSITSNSRTFPFPVLQNVWMIPHNMGTYPAVTCVDSTNAEIDGDVDYVDSNNISITFSNPESGIAYLN